MIHWYVLMSVRPWDSLEVVGTPWPTSTATMPGRGYMPVYETLEELREHHGSDAPYITIAVSPDSLNSSS